MVRAHGVSERRARGSHGWRGARARTVQAQCQTPAAELRGSSERRSRPQLRKARRQGARYARVGARPGRRVRELGSSWGGRGAHEWTISVRMSGRPCCSASSAGLTPRILLACLARARQRAALAGSSTRRSWPLHGQAAHGGRWAGGDLDVRAEAEERKDNVCVTVARREVQGREPLLVLCADRRAKVGELRYCARRASRRGRMQRCLLEEVKRIQRCVLSDQEPVRALARQAISSLTSAAGGAGPRAELAGQGALSVC